MILGSTNDCQQTNKMCFTGLRAMRALAICTRTRYADNLCDRLRCYICPALIMRLSTQKQRVPIQWLSNVEISPCRMLSPIIRNGRILGILTLIVRCSTCERRLASRLEYSISRPGLFDALLTLIFFRILHRINSSICFFRLRLRLRFRSERRQVNKVSPKLFLLVRKGIEHANHRYLVSYD